MLILTNISVVDLITVCLITVACVITMIGIIVVSSKSPKGKKKVEDEISFKMIEEEYPSKKEAESLFIEEHLKEEESDLNQIKEQKIEPIHKNKTNIEDVLTKLENEIGSEKGEKKHTFEQEQEQKAIISYKELLKVAGKLKLENNEVDDELEEPIKKTLKEMLVSEEPLENHNSKFHNSEFISPIYGKQESRKEETYIQGTKNIENETENKQFLSALKDLRKNLE